MCQIGSPSILAPRAHHTRERERENHLCTNIHNMHFTSFFYFCKHTGRWRLHGLTSSNPILLSGYNPIAFEKLISNKNHQWKYQRQRQIQNGTVEPKELIYSILYSMYKRVCRKSYDGKCEIDKLTSGAHHHFVLRGAFAHGFFILIIYHMM